ncbi:T9SS type A sorting domain-containing protein [Flagellimonas sp.]|uniref:T9SS type A sorting domain-containing protein n=1 Tax=Flagellimonas sp. TaxID=2058762 RepID=UPI003B52906A
MRKITFLILILTCTTVFSNGNSSILTNDVKIIEVLADSLENVNYSNFDFEVPTKIIFPNLTYIDGDILAESSKNLVELDFKVLDSIRGSIYIWESPDFRKINAPGLKSALGTISFYSNPKLEIVNFTGLIKTGRDIHFVHNPKLLEFNTPKLESTGDNFYFHSNINLIEINAPSLKSVAKHLSIHGHEKLQKLNLCSLEFALYTDISGNNPVVEEPPYCPDLFDDEEEEEDKEDESEDEEDESEDEVEEVEDTDDDNLEEEEGSEDDPRVVDEPTRVALYPNPARGVFRIDSEIEFYKIEIYEATGNLVTTFRSSQEEYDISLLPAGLYYVVAHHTDGVHATVKKLMVL